MMLFLKKEFNRSKTKMPSKINLVALVELLKKVLVFQIISYMM
ncbi:hypothetical protein OENI_10218 [Oenococcus oeni]|nr:hypothetical protein OENI_10218 [Oenococcus oeni]